MAEAAVAAEATAEVAVAASKPRQFSQFKEGSSFPKTALFSMFRTCEKKPKEMCEKIKNLLDRAGGR